MKTVIPAILFVIVSSTAGATEWQLGFDLSHSASPIAEYFPFPVADILNISTIYGAYQSSYFRVGFGPSFSDDYYALLPNREAAFAWHTGIELETRIPGDMTWRDVQPPQADQPSDFLQPYTRIAIEQILLGDRYHRKGSLGLAFVHTTRYLHSRNDSTIDPFFLHSPTLSLNLRIAEDPFWSPAALLMHISAPIELGHTLGGPVWAFLGVTGDLDARLPIAAELLYVQLEASASVPQYDFFPERTIPNYAYAGYDNRYNWGAQVNVKSRVLVLDPFFRLAIEPAVFGSVAFSGDTLVVESLDELNLKVGAFVEFKVFHADVAELIVRGGVAYDVNSDGLGIVFTVR